jgi:hypothetical protein
MVLITVIAAMIAGSAVSQTSSQKIEAAITTIRILERPGRDNLATVWDGNKYVQCQGRDQINRERTLSAAERTVPEPCRHYQ